MELICLGSVPPFLGWNFNAGAAFTGITRQNPMNDKDILFYNIL